MELGRLMTSYVSLTQPVGDASVLLLMLQLILQSAAPAMLLFSAVKRRPLLDRFLLCVVPMVFFITYAIMDILLGGSFLGGGFRRIPELVVYLTVTPRLWREVGVLLALFPIAFFVARRWGRYSLISLPGDVSIGALWAFTVWVTFHIVQSGAMPALGPVRPGDVALWYVYAVYTILAQLFLNLAALVIHVMFQPWKPKGDPEEGSHDDGWCRRTVARLLSEGHRVFLYCMGSLTLLLYALVIPALIQEGVSGDLWSFFGFLGAITLWCLFLLYRVLFPGTLPACRRIFSQEGLARRFCKEYFDPVRPPRQGDTVQLTRSFLLDRTPLRSGLYYLPGYEGMETHGQGRRLRFQDGGTLELDRLPIKDRVLVVKAMAPWARENGYKRL